MYLSLLSRVNESRGGIHCHAFESNPQICLRFIVVASLHRMSHCKWTRNSAGYRKEFQVSLSHLPRTELRHVSRVFMVNQFTPTSSVRSTVIAAFPIGDRSLFPNRLLFCHLAPFLSTVFCGFAWRARMNASHNGTCHHARRSCGHVVSTFFALVSFWNELRRNDPDDLGRKRESIDWTIGLAYWLSSRRRPPRRIIFLLSAMSYLFVFVEMFK